MLFSCKSLRLERLELELLVWGAATFYVVSCVHSKLDCCKFLSKLMFPQYE